MLFCQRRNYNQKKKLKGIYESSNVSARSTKSGKQMPNLTNAIYGEAEPQTNTRELPPPPDSINDVSSGYMNSSYEAIGGDNLKAIPPRGIRNLKSSDKSSSSRASQRPKSQVSQPSIFIANEKEYFHFESRYPAAILDTKMLRF